ncbi:CD209 antigen-like protein C isoform X2 [Morone saxatilis]|uniref:CD209 antigen-like protein C isoform X2 n=1 Tax=Morone saxatilis TaxID=34816 RepID=UPI0015E220A5|nr:CD209 antigen-like protein C isoform X2 [Morone saxatilis]
MMATVNRSQSSVCWIGASALCLGLILLTVILVSHNTNTISHWDKKYANLIYEITKSRDELTHERDQLKMYSSNLAEEMEVLQSQYDTVAASRDKLQEELNRLNLNRTDKPCRQGWIQFNNKCYYLSAAKESKTWEESRKDCQEREADLVIITTKAELEFVKRSSSVTWIGLSRGEQQDEWKWVDGTNLEGEGFWEDGEPNNNGGIEDCVEVARFTAAWNDAPCNNTFSWVCEH